MAAHAYSRVSGKPGVCFAASGPGATNLITGVGNAFLDAVPGRRPWRCQCGRANRYGRVSGNGPGRDVQADYQVVRAGNRCASHTEIINKAFRVATSGQPGPVYVDLPGDVLYRRIDDSEVLFPKRAHVTAAHLGNNPARKHRFGAA